MASPPPKLEFHSPRVKTSFDTGSKSAICIINPSALPHNDRTAEKKTPRHFPLKFQGIQEFQLFYSNGEHLIAQRAATKQLGLVADTIDDAGRLIRFVANLV